MVAFFKQKNPAGFRRAVAGPPYKIVRPYGSYFVAYMYMFLNMPTFAAKFVRFLSLQDSRKADSKRSYDSS